MATQIQLRRDTAANWTSSNPVLAQAEPGYETDTGKIKYGDGSTAWNSLVYAESDQQFSGGSASSPSITFTGDTNTGIYSPGADQLALSTSGVGRVFVDANGNVGIGAASTGGKFEVSAGASSYGSITIGAGTTGALSYAYSSSATGSTFYGLSDASTAGYQSFGSTATYGTYGAYPLVLGTSNQERLRITSAGLVGIGTSAPDRRLTVANTGGDSTVNILASTTGESVLYFADSTSGAGSYAGYLQYIHSTDNLAIGCAAGEAIRIDASRRVGIGTSAPSGLLHVSGGRTLLSSSDGYELAFARTGNYFYCYNDGGNLSGKLSLTTSAGAGGGEIITFTQDTKRVGIGTTSPGFKLDLYDSASAKINCDFNGTNKLTLGADNNGAFLDSTGSNGLTFYTNGSQRARIDTSGRLLVGTSSSLDLGSRLQVVNESGVPLALFTGRNDLYGPDLILAKARGSTASPTVVSSGDQVGEIVFKGYSGAAGAYVEAARIEGYVDGAPDSGGDTTDMPGRLVFSTTADGASSPTERMRISSAGVLTSNSTSTGYVVSTTVGAGTSTALFGGNHSGTGSPSSGTTSFIVWSNGNVVNTNNSYGAISDIKLKENIADAASQWSDIKALQVRKYNFKEGQTHTQIGLVAQEVELVSPGLVSESPDRDEEGNDLGTVTKSVNYSVLYMKAVKALQEAMERIETLEASNTDLLARVSALESA